MTLYMRDRENREEGRREGREEGRREGRREGRQEGRQEGIELGILLSAKKLLEKGMDIDVVSEMLEINREELEKQLKEEQK